MNKFLVIVLIIGFFTSIFLGLSLTGLGIWSWVISVSLILTILCYPLVWFVSLPDSFDILVRKIIYAAMGMTSFLIGLLCLRNLIFMPLTFFKPNLTESIYSQEFTLGLIVIAFIMLIIGYYNASKQPKVMNVEIPFSNLDPQLENFRIAQISDLHAGSATGLAFIKNIVKTTGTLKPDVIMLTGDIADGEFKRYQDSVMPLQELSDFAPVYYVTGNHEFIKDYEQWIQKFKDYGMKILLNEHLVMNYKDQKIMIAGVIDPAGRQFKHLQGPDLTETLKGAGDVDFKILLAHQPDIAVKASKHFDLQLSGHTHAGQFFPWIFVIHLFQRFTKGLYKLDSMWIYVNQGTGFWGPPIRLGTRSEISLIKLVGDKH